MLTQPYKVFFLPLFNVHIVALLGLTDARKTLDTYEPWTLFLVNTYVINLCCRPENQMAIVLFGSSLLLLCSDCNVRIYLYIYVCL